MDGSAEESEHSSCSEPIQLKSCKGSKSSSKARLCQAKGCTVDLLHLNKPYNKKKRLCQAHIKADCIERCNAEGLWRFCQQCGKLEPLALFEGAKRSCSRGLQRRRETSSAHTKGKKQQHIQQQQQQQDQAELAMHADQCMREAGGDDIILQQMLLIQQKQAELAAVQQQQQQQLLHHASVATGQNCTAWPQQMRLPDQAVQLQAVQQQQQQQQHSAVAAIKEPLTSRDLLQSLLAPPPAADPAAAAAAAAVPVSRTLLAAEQAAAALRNDLLNGLMQDMAAARPMSTPPVAAAAAYMSHDNVVTSLLEELSCMRPASAGPAAAGRLRGVSPSNSVPLPTWNAVQPCSVTESAGATAAAAAQPITLLPAYADADLDMAALDEIEKVIEEQLLAAIQLQHQLSANPVAPDTLQQPQHHPRQQLPQQPLQPTLSAPATLPSPNNADAPSTLQQQPLQRQTNSAGRSPFAAVGTPAAAAMLAEHETLRSQLSASLRSLSLSCGTNSLRTPSVTSMATGPMAKPGPDKQAGTHPSAPGGQAGPDNQAGTHPSGPGGQAGPDTQAVRTLVNGARSSRPLVKLEPVSQVGRMRSLPAGFSAPLPQLNPECASAPKAQGLRSLSGPSDQAGPDSQAVEMLPGLTDPADASELASTLVAKLRNMTAEYIALRQNINGMMGM